MVIYLAGPYRGKSKIKIINWFQRQINIHRAREAAKRLWAAGFTVLCPHLNTANFDGIAPDEVFLNGTLELMRRREWECPNCHTHHDRDINASLNLRKEALRLTVGTTGIA